MTGDPRLTRRRLNRLAGLSTLVLGFGAVATNLATAALPDWAEGVASDPRWTWSAAGGFLLAAVLLAVRDQRLSAVAESPGATNLPARNASFVGRRWLLRQMRKALTAGPVAVIAVHGLGGTGKSQLVLEFAHRSYCSGKYSVVWWIRADTRVTLLEDLADLGEKLGEGRRADREKAAADATAQLAGRDGWLLVFDNARASDEVRPWLPAGTGCAVITSRNRGWGSIATQVDLVQFRRRESLRYLRLRAGRRRYDRAAATELAEALGDLPLALAQAASYLEVYDLTVSDFLDRYRDRGMAGQLLAGSVEGYPESVATTWLLHHDRLIREAPDALELLRLCSFLDTDDIDLDLLEINAPDGDPRPIEGPLVTASLIDRVAGRRVRVHRLVAEATRLHLAADISGSETVGGWAARVIAKLDDLFPNDPSDRTNWPRCAALSGHVTIAVEHASNYGVTTGPIVALAARQSSYLQASQTSAPVATGRRAVSRMRAAVGPMVEALTGRYERAYLRLLSRSLRYTGDTASAGQSTFTLELSQTYVDVSATSQAGPEQRSIVEFLNAGIPGVVIVLGDPGSGKSTLLRYLAASAATASRPHRRLPILVSARTVAGRADFAPLPEIARLNAYVQAAEPVGWWEKRLVAGRCLVLVDGLDEVFDASGRQAVADWIERQVAAYPLNQYVITSRPVGYLEAALPGALVMQLAPFSWAQVGEFITRWYLQQEIQAIGVDSIEAERRAAKAAEELQAALGTSHALREIARVPLLLTMIANVHRFRQALPLGTAELYGEIVDSMLRRSDDRESTMSAIWRVPVLARAAFALSQQRSQQLSRAEAVSVVAAAPELPTDVAPEGFLDDAVRSGLIVDEGVYAFAHLTIQEYLAARHLRDHNLPVDGYINDPMWRQILVFAAQMGLADEIISACYASNSDDALRLAEDCGPYA
ncbi:NACHT domain-containing protein [Actinoplanes auranticolor]|uniref:NACHT domain-containing protein n=1 Tax=Actinoplanes auranticolor TaxID=47988 RepID=A0A919SRY9_9ACTN|nr:NACHT domain-containing protein [Actinoplanes auranticolor]GIM76382.1 hypothetical protein Aau02nite_70590 [Actinoplanes auranticolor]